MSGMVRWEDGEGLPLSRDTPRSAVPEEVRVAWANTRAKMEARGWKFVDHAHAGPNVSKFGFRVTHEKPLQDAMDSIEAALSTHFGAKPGHGFVLLRAAPSLVFGDDMQDYVRGRFGHVLTLDEAAL